MISRWGGIDDGEGGQTSRHNVNLEFEAWVEDGDHFTTQANLTFSPTAAVDLFLNFGQGFHSNDARIVVTGQVIADQVRALEEWGATPQEIRTAFQQINFDTNQAEITSLPRTTGAEIGLRSRMGRRLNFGSALWWIDVDEEYIYIADVGVPEQRGRPRRTGVDVERACGCCPGCGLMVISICRAAACGTRQMTPTVFRWRPRARRPAA